MKILWMRQFWFTTLVTITLLNSPTQAQTNRTDIRGMHVAGYQGWFRCPSDDPKHLWRRWFRNGSPLNGVTVDMWPDLREVPEIDRCDSGLRTENGSVVWAFSSLNPNISDLHARWANEYKIDAFALQRFTISIQRPSGRIQNDIVLNNMRSSLKRYGVNYYVMYDISGTSPETWADTIFSDISSLLTQGIFNDENYVTFKGRPVIAIWGLGVGGRPASAAQTHDLISRISKMTTKFALVAGVSSAFLSEKQPNGADWLDVYKRFDIISPWYVGATRSTTDIRGRFRSAAQRALNWSKTNSIEFLPVVFPGFSWANLKNDPSRENGIPRQCGDLYIEQANMLLSIGSNMIYTAMFDELDEGTAIFKTIEKKSDGPVNHPAVTLDEDGCALSSDHYLKLAGKITTMLRSRPHHLQQ